MINGVTFIGVLGSSDPAERRPGGGGDVFDCGAEPGRPTVPRVNDADEQQDLRALLQILEKIDPWVEAVTTDGPSAAWEVQPRSPLSTDDARTHPYHVSHRAWMSITPAVDFLACLRNSIIGTREEDRLSVRLHSYGQAGLIRGALENACCAVWLLGPPRMERVTNRLRLEWKELTPAYRLRTLVGGLPTRTIEERKKQLADLLIAAHAAGATAGETPAINDVDTANKALRGLGYAEMVRRAGEVSGVGADTTEAAWSMCSALAHGDASATLGLLDTEVIRQSAPGINLARTSPHVQLLAYTTLIACGMTRRAFRLLQERRHAPY